MCVSRKGTQGCDTKRATISSHYSFPISIFPFVFAAVGGKARAEIGLLLRTIGALGIALDAKIEGPARPKDTSVTNGADTHVDIDSIVASARRKRK